MSTLAEQANSLLDFSGKLDIQLLDNVINCMYKGHGQQQQMAQQVLTSLKEHPDAWTRVDTMLEYSSDNETKYYALQILEHVIKTRWKALPRQQCEGIKKYIVSLIIKTSSDSEALDKKKVFLGKLNMILVQILKYEWPKNWPTFISDIVGSSKTNETLCQNNMMILKLLSEEVFDFSTGQMTQTKAKHLKENMCSEFSVIFQLAQFVMENSQNATLVGATLETLLRFLNWIPLGYIFETNLISSLIDKFLDVPMFRNVTLKCLTEIAGIQATQYNQHFCTLFQMAIAKLEQMMPPTMNLREAYQNGKDDEQNFIQNLALFLVTIMKEHGSRQFEVEGLKEQLGKALNYLTLISEVDETEIFKICLDYWNAQAAELYRETPNPSAGQSPLLLMGGLMSGAMRQMEMSPRLALYKATLSKLRRVMISRMAKPEEVLVVENEQGEVVREFMKDTDSINLYKNMRETLVYLTHLDYVDTEMIMTEKLHNQVNGTEWSWKNLNTLCWAIGSISGAMHEEDEKRFLVTVIKDLLGLCEQKRGKDNKAIIASNIMYVVGQYPRFLRAHWRFLKTVVNKNFEFMHETHDGVQDMACDTFLKIAQKCRRHFVQIQVGEAVPFIEEILGSINTIICDLNPQQVHTFYEAVGLMIGAQTEPEAQEMLIEKYMSLPNQVWDQVIARASTSVDILKDPEVIKQLGNILKTNVRACKSLGHPYVKQLGRIYLDMLNVYKVMSENITTACVTNGNQVVKQPLIKGMRTVKKETLKLIGSWVSRSNDPAIVSENFIAPLLEAVLLDYKRGVPASREPEVLGTMATIVSKLGNHITKIVPEIFDAVFECTLDMINKDFEEFPEHRTEFFTLLQAVNSHCFAAFLEIPPPQFKLVLDSVIWAFKHTMRNISEIGLDILHTMLKNISQHDQAAQNFYSLYYTDIVQHVFSVVADSVHTGGLTAQSTILAYLFLILEGGQVTVQLSPDLPAAQNVQFVQNFMLGLLKSAFPNLLDAQIKVFIEGLFSFNNDITQFKEHLRDFLVQIKEFAGDDPSDLFLEERERMIVEANETKRKQQQAVPGILGPHESGDADSEMTG